jgi:hypothetical protein
MRSCFQQNFSGLLWVLSLLPLPLSPSLPLTAGGPVIPHAANGGRKRRGGDVSAVLRRQRKRRRTCTWTISTPTSGTSARSVAHPTPAHPAPLRSPLVSVWVVGSQAGQLGSAGSGWFLGQFIGYSHCRSRIDCVALLLNLGSRAWLLIEAFTCVPLKKMPHSCVPLKSWSSPTCPRSNFSFPSRHSVGIWS